ncbi:MAG: hypothetical protein JOZ25_00205 [Actinobacteria bacterium]|nr:hypothetical protein [Actinomycetota bacterium]
MRSLSQRARMCALLVAMCSAVVFPVAAQARKHPSPNGKHNVSINVSENPVVAGDPIVIFGHLTGPNNGNRVVTLWYRLNTQSQFTAIQSTNTDSQGFYVFFRQKNVVNTNRHWFVRSVGARSRTIYERVYSQVTLSGPADGSTLLTGYHHRETFTGTVWPYSAGTRVLLQRHDPNTENDTWNTIQKSRVQPGGTFKFVHTFRVPGDAQIRVLVRATRRNIASPSNSLSYQIQQAQNPNLTLTSSQNPIVFGQSITLSGTLKDGAGKEVDLLAKTAQSSWTQVGQTTAGNDGSYSFLEMPAHNTIYQTKGDGRFSATLFEGVRDLLTANVSSTTVDAGDPVTFSGTVSPDKTGHVIYLQRQNASGSGFHDVAASVVHTGSTYSITRRLYAPGTAVYRVFIPGGPGNWGAASQQFTITVNQDTPAQVNNGGSS